LTEDETHLLANLRQRVEVEGPIALHVTREEFEVLKKRVKQFWKQESWPKTHDYVVLSYLRAYTFYRELVENDRVFWDTFFMFLGLPTETNRCYDLLEEMLERNAHTREYFIKSESRREFVKSIDAIWGLKSLSGRQLATVFRRYYFRHPGAVVTKELLQDLLHEADDVALRQTASYDIIFREMSRVIDTVLEHDKTIDDLSPSLLTLWLAEKGVNFSVLNPVEFFYNKTSTTLKDLIHQLRGSVRIKSHNETRKINDVEVRLSPNCFTVGESITLEFDQLPDAELKLNITNWQGDDVVYYRFYGRQFTLQGSRLLEIGGYWLQVFADGEPMTLRRPIHVLPLLKWQPNLRDVPLLEGSVMTGKVHAADDETRFTVFRWQPRLAYERGRWSFPPSLVRVELDAEKGVVVEAELQAETLGCRIIDTSSDDVVEELDGAKLNTLNCIHSHPTWGEVRAYLESEPEYTLPVNEESLTSLAAFYIRKDDSLVIERRVRHTWHVLLRLPVTPSHTSEHLIRELCKTGVGWFPFTS
jgi:hypothetical protein